MIINRNDKPKEFIQVEKYVEEGEYDGALKLLDILEKKNKIQIYEKLTYYHLKGQLLIWQAKYDEAIKLCEVMYRLSQLNDNQLKSVDALILLTHIYTYQFKHDEALKVILKVEEILKKIPQESKQLVLRKRAHLIYCQGLIFFHEGNSIKSFEFLENSIASREKFGSKQELAESLYSTGRFFAYDGKFDRALKLIDRSLTLATESKSMFYVGLCYNSLGAINLFKGKINKSVQYLEKSLEIFKKIKNHFVIAGLFNNLSGIYQLKGDSVRALDYIDQTLEIEKNVDIDKTKCSSLDTAIQISLELNDVDRAKIYLQYLEKINNSEKSEKVNLIYLYNKALILKSSLLKSDQIRASEILKEIVGKKFPFLFEISIKALLNLSDILLTELYESSNLLILDQIQFHIDQILDIALNQELHWLLVESYILEIKLNLITLNINNAQETLAKAQNVAKKYDLNQLLERLSREQKNLSIQKNKWKNLKDSDQIIVELANLAPLKEQIQYMLKKREIFKRLM